MFISPPAYTTYRRSSNSLLLRHCREGNENWSRLSAVQLFPRATLAPSFVCAAVQRRAAPAAIVLWPMSARPAVWNRSACWGAAVARWPDSRAGTSWRAVSRRAGTRGPARIRLAGAESVPNRGPGLARTIGPCPGSRLWLPVILIEIGGTAVPPHSDLRWTAPQVYPWAPW
jgi:hypothetical protein